MTETILKVETSALVPAWMLRELADEQAERYNEGNERCLNALADAIEDADVNWDSP